MKTIAEKQAVQRTRTEELRKRDEADMQAVAKLFSTEEGRYVLELLMRRFGVLGTRFDVNAKGELDAIRAGIRDGQTAVPLFIVQCLKKAGESSISFPI